MALNQFVEIKVDEVELKQIAKDLDVILPPKRGTKTIVRQAMRKAMKLHNDLKKEWGEDKLNKFLNTEFTVKEHREDLQGDPVPWWDVRHNSTLEEMNKFNDKVENQIINKHLSIDKKFNKKNYGKK